MFQVANLVLLTILVQNSSLKRKRPLARQEDMSYDSKGNRQNLSIIEKNKEQSNFIISDENFNEKSKNSFTALNTIDLTTEESVYTSSGDTDEIMSNSSSGSEISFQKIIESTDDDSDSITSIDEVQLSDSNSEENAISQKKGIENTKKRPENENSHVNNDVDRIEGPSSSSKSGEQTKKNPSKNYIIANVEYVEKSQSTYTEDESLCELNKMQLAWLIKRYESVFTNQFLDDSQKLKVISNLFYLNKVQEIINFKNEINYDIINKEYTDEPQSEKYDDNCTNSDLNYIEEIYKNFKFVLDNYKQSNFKHFIHELYIGSNRLYVYYKIYYNNHDNKLSHSFLRHLFRGKKEKTLYDDFNKFLRLENSIFYSKNMADKIINELCKNKLSLGSLYEIFIKENFENYDKHGDLKIKYKILLLRFLYEDISNSFSLFPEAKIICYYIKKYGKKNPDYKDINFFIFVLYIFKGIARLPWVKTLNNYSQWSSDSYENNKTNLKKTYTNKIAQCTYFLFLAMRGEMYIILNFLISPFLTPDTFMRYNRSVLYTIINDLHICYNGLMDTSCMPKFHPISPFVRLFFASEILKINNNAIYPIGFFLTSPFDTIINSKINNTNDQNNPSLRNDIEKIDICEFNKINYTKIYIKKNLSKTNCNIFDYDYLNLYDNLDIRDKFITSDINLIHIVKIFILFFNSLSLIKKGLVAKWLNGYFQEPVNIALINYLELSLLDVETKTKLADLCSKTFKNFKLLNV
ncbi:hypothetical protein COBT_000481 [Conglomerata obtusa]